MDEIIEPAPTPVCLTQKVVSSLGADHVSVVECQDRQKRQTDTSTFSGGSGLLAKPGEVGEDRLQLEGRIGQRNQWQSNAEAVKRFCALATKNIEGFSFQDKRLALEALQLKVWIDGDNISIEGAVPVDGGDIVSNASRCTQPTISCNSYGGQGVGSGTRQPPSLAYPPP